MGVETMKKLTIRVLAMAAVLTVLAVLLAVPALAADSFRGAALLPLACGRRPIGMLILAGVALFSTGIYNRCRAHRN